MIKKLFFTVILTLILSTVFTFVVSAQPVNLFDPSKLGTATNNVNNGITYTYNGDGSFTLNGTATDSSSYAFIVSQCAISLEPGTYVLSGFDNDGSMVNVKLLDDSAFNFSTNGEVGFFTIEAASRLRGNLIINKGVTFDNYVFKPYLFKLEVADFGTPGTVGEYMETDEYKQAMQNQYSAGAELGYSSGYSSGEASGYSEGYSCGYNNFKLSTEFSNEIKKSYDSGYKIGYSEGEENSAVNGIFFVLLPCIWLSVILLFTLTFIKSRKKKKRR